jgi:hypothetical protein
VFGLVAAALLLILGVAIECASTGTCGAAYGSTFKATPGLMTDDAAGCCADEATGHGTALGVRAGWFRAVAKAKGTKAGNDDEIYFFHGDG